MKIALAAILVSFSICCAAQAVTGEPAVKPTVNKKIEPKKKHAKKAAPPKAASRKPRAPNKPRAPAKPAVASKPAIYDGKDPKAPILRDKEGNAIPTNPNAYDVSSAVGKKK